MPLSFKGAAELLSCCMLWERFIPVCFLFLTSVSVRLLPGRKEGIPGWWSVPCCPHLAFTVSRLDSFDPEGAGMAKLGMEDLPR